jgi:hypothetical protein
MSKETIANRFAKLRSLREKLCDKGHTWNEAFQARDWVVNELKDVMNLCNATDTSKEEVAHKVTDILKVLDPQVKEPPDDN